MNENSPTSSKAAGHGRTQRIASFDGARGLMALFIAVWHCFLIVSPAILAWVLAHPRTSAAWWWSVGNPTELLRSALVVFFILSGIVLTLPAGRPGFSWLRYFPSRLLRLYLPAWAALVLGVALIFAFPRGNAAPDTWLGGTNATHVGIGQALWEATLLPQYPTIDNPLWAMAWEVAFSVFLPLFVFLARKTTGRWLWLIGASVLVAAIGEQIHSAAMMYMPTFFIGSLVAANIQKVMSAAVVISSSRWHALWWWLIVVASLVFIGGFRITESMALVKPFTLINHVLASTTVIGYMGFLFIALGNRRATRFLGTRPLQRLGGISYSLYLVHVPILATLAFALEPEVWWVPIIGLPLAILVAIVFARFVEWPSHRFGRAVGRAAAARTAIQPPGRSRSAGQIDESGSG